jgi:hypothetical protein
VEGKRPRSRRVKFPLIVSDGPKVDLTNEQIYEHLEFLTRTPGWRFSGAATFTRKGQEHGLKVAAKRSSSSAESCKSLFFDF